MYLLLQKHSIGAQFVLCIYILGYILGINASVGIIVTHSSIQSPNFAYMQLEVEMLLILVTP